MKIYGYATDTREQEHAVAKELTEISLEAGANELRMIAAFLNETADSMDRMGTTYDHEHLSDANHYFDSSPHFVVVRPR